MYCIFRPMSLQALALMAVQGGLSLVIVINTINNHNSNNDNDNSNIVI